MALEAENIEARPVWKPMHMQPVFAGTRIFGGAVSERLFQNGLCLPSGSSLSTEDQDRVISIHTASIPRVVCTAPELAAWILPTRAGYTESRGDTERSPRLKTAVILRTVSVLAIVLAVATVSAPLALGQAPSDQTKGNYVIGSQDVLSISVWDQPDLSGKFTVEADGKFHLSPHRPNHGRWTGRCATSRVNSVSGLRMATSRIPRYP